MNAHKNIRLLAWFNFFTDFKLYSAIAAIYFSQVTGSLALGMAVFSIAYITDAVFEIPTGILSDRVGRKNTVILGAISAIFYSVFYAVGTSFWILIVGALFEGLSRAFYSGNNDALLHDSLIESGKVEEYHAFLGKLSSLFQAALAFGALIGSVLASRSFAVVMWLSVIPQVICFLISFKIIEPKIRIQKSANIYSHLDEAVKLFISNKKLRTISLAGIISTGIGEAIFKFKTIFYQTLWPLWAIGIASMISYVAAGLSFFFSGKLINKFGETKILLVGNIQARLVNIVFALFPSTLSPLFMSTTGLFYGASEVSRNSLMQKEFTPHQRATMSSLDSLAGSIMFAVLAYLLGIIGDFFGPAKTLIIAQLIALIGTYLYWQIFHGKNS